MFWCWIVSLFALSLKQVDSTSSSPKLTVTSDETAIMDSPLNFYATVMNPQRSDYIIIWIENWPHEREKQETLNASNNFTSNWTLIYSSADNYQGNFSIMVSLYYKFVGLLVTVDMKLQYFTITSHFVGDIEVWQGGVKHPEPFRVATRNKTHLIAKVHDPSNYLKKANKITYSWWNSTSFLTNTSEPILTMNFTEEGVHSFNVFVSAVFNYSVTKTGVFGANVTAVKGSPSGNRTEQDDDNLLDRNYPNYFKVSTPKSTTTVEVRYKTFKYYNTTYVPNGSLYWVDFESHPDAVEHDMLSSAHRRAATLKLKFNFPFYGHLVDNVFISTGGFLYLGEQEHAWLAATQYVAPLMANFDSSLSENSAVKYLSTNEMFSVEWNKVQLNDAPEKGSFTFQSTLYKNGTILFAYKSIPIDILNISDTSHPVKVGLSDAFIRDKNVLLFKQKTIYEYDRVELRSSNKDIGNGTAIVFTPLPTCLSYKSCYECNHEVTSFECAWCPSVGRCSDGTDRHRQSWLNWGCETNNVTQAEHCGIASTPISQLDIESTTILGREDFAGEELIVSTTAAPIIVDQGSILHNIASLQIEKMLSSPRAKLYSGENVTGDSEFYNSARTGEGGCYDLQDLKRVKSVDTMDKCVRVFASDGCTGWSAAIYPGSDTEASLRFLNSSVTSVGPCLPDEFQSSTFNTEDQTFVKDASDLRNNIPDLAEFLSLDKYQRKSKGESFVLGPNRRTELVRVSLRKRNLPETIAEMNELDASEENQLHPMTGSEPGDIVGMMQPASLGGLSTNDWNVFPQTPSGKKAWLQETSDIRPYLRRSDDNWVTLHTNVMYEDDESTRPYAFYYFLVYGNGNVVERRAYGHIAN